MPKLATPRRRITNLGELLKQLGDIPPDRVRLRPAPGSAKERHVVWIDDHEDRLCELLDGVLVEKALGARESFLACVLVQILGTFVEKHDLGVVLGEAGMLRLRPGLVRIPDVSFISWERIPSGEFPAEPIPDLVPDLAVEILSEGNTRGEIARKLREYFEAGTRIVWVIDPRARAVEVYSSATDRHRLRNGQTLDGGDVLPGFKLPLKSFFARLTRRSKK